ncbi:MAG: macro domain-containing protein [Thermomicrobiales bacterium]|nr:macro domain-containing protein [Thermomicrobiales bacterium]
MEERERPIVDVIVGDIADVATHQAEVYVNAANNELWMGAGVAGALKRAAGTVVEEEAMAQGPIEVGNVVLTSAGAMPAPARAIIHAAAMGFTDRTQIYASPESVASTTRKALDLCDANHYGSIVLPALGTGVGGLDDTDCATAMVSALRDHLAAGSDLQRIRFIVRTPERAEVFRREIERVLG